jgi:hypothetical protein
MGERLDGIEEVRGSIPLGSIEEEVEIERGRGASL